MTRRCVSFAAAVAAAVLVAHPALALELVLGGELGGGAGVEGGDPGGGDVRFRRARTRIVGALEMRVDDDMKDGVIAMLFAEVEPHTGAGASLRYARWLSPNVYGFAGLTGAFAPHTLFGGEVGVQIQIPIDKTLGVFVEPSFAALPLGTDLPADRVLLWGLLSAGIHANL
jgi:hypothetical protein